MTRILSVACCIVGFIHGVGNINSDCLYSRSNQPNVYAAFFELRYLKLYIDEIGIGIPGTRIGIRVHIKLLHQNFRYSSPKQPFSSMT